VLLLGGADLCSGVGILLRKTFDPACSIDQLLFAGEERVAVRTNFDAQHVAFNSRARGKSVPAGTVYGYLMIVGVNTGFHGAPVCRVRSARLPGWDTTAASLGRETISNYTQKRKDLLTGAGCPGRACRLFTRKSAFSPITAVRNASEWRILRSLRHARPGRRLLWARPEICSRPRLRAPEGSPRHICDHKFPQSASRPNDP